MKKLSILLQKPVLQRFFYFLFLFLYNFLIFKNGGIRGNSSIGIPFFWFWIIPSLTMLYQVIFNNLYGWLLFLLLYIIYFLWSIISIISEFLIEDNDWGFYSIFFLILFFVLLSCFGWIIWQIKPRKKNNPSSLFIVGVL